MTAKEIIAVLNEIEDTIDVQNWIVNEINPWPMLRTHLNFVLDSMNKKESSNNYQKLQTHLIGLFAGIGNLAYNFKYLNFTSKKADILFITTSKRKQSKLEGKWFNNLIDPLIPMLETKNYSYQIIEYSNDYDFRLPGLQKVKIIQIQYFINIIIAKFYENRIEFNEITKLNLKKISDILSNSNLNSCILTEKLFKKKLAQLIVNANFLKKILKKVLPKVVVGSNAELAVNFACHSLNIISVDYQHGYQGDYHGGYSSWKNVPTSGYELLPKFFFVWGESEKKVIEKWCKNTSHKAIIIGNPALYYFSNKNMKYKTNAKSDSINVLISLQNPRGLIDLYKSLIMNNSYKIFWWIRLHPCMTKAEVQPIRNYISELKRDNIDLEKASESPLYELLPIIDVHITENSMVVNDSLQFNIPSIVTHSSGAEYFENEINRNQVFYEYEKRKILDKILSISKTSINRQMIYSDFEDRLLTELNNLINK